MHWRAGEDGRVYCLGSLYLTGMIKGTDSGGYIDAELRRRTEKI